MVRSLPALSSFIASGLLLSGCALPSGTQIVVVGESGAGGFEAANEVNNIIANAESSGCEAISVGGYAAGARVEGGGLLVGIPVLIECPQGTQLLPDGTVAP